jgi:hypothetical protein
MAGATRVLETVRTLGRLAGDTVLEQVLSSLSQLAANNCCGKVDFLDTRVDEEIEANTCLMHGRHPERWLKDKIGRKK